MLQRRSALQPLLATLLIGCSNPGTLLEPAEETAALAAKTNGTDVTSSADAWLASRPAGFAENQEALLQFNGWLAEQPSLHEAGYVASIQDTASRSMTLLWNGLNPVPEAVTRRAITDGIVLKTRPWLLSYAQIQTAAQTLAGLGRHFYGAFGFNLADVVGIEPSYEGVSIEGRFDSSVNDVAAAAQRLTAQAQALVGVPVRIISNVSAGPATSRQNDRSPFSAGGYMISPSSGYRCSSGFAIEIGGVTHTTTARHCPDTDYVARDAPGNPYGLGSSTVVNPGAARYLGGAGGPLVWDGGYNTEDYRKTVIGFGDVAIGTEVCTSGGNSGVHCQVYVQALSVWWDDGNGPTEMIKGEQRNSSAIALIQGDSGGPVFVPLWCLFNIACRVRAVGMIQAYTDDLGIGTGAFCGPVRDPGSRDFPAKCSRTVLFSPMRTIVNGIPGASLVHG